MGPHTRHQHFSRLRKVKMARQLGLAELQAPVARESGFCLQVKST